jgi:hypothetical protein
LLAGACQLVGHHFIVGLNMKTTVNMYDFIEAFRSCDRMDNFSREGLELLFEYLEEYEESCGVEVELDVIALCCDYSEDTWQSIAENYSIEYDENENEDEGKNVVRQYLEDNTQLIGETSSGFVYACF